MTHLFWLTVVNYFAHIHLDKTWYILTFYFLSVIHIWVLIVAALASISSRIWVNALIFQIMKWQDSVSVFYNWYTVVSKQCLLYEVLFHTNWQLDHCDAEILTYILAGWHFLWHTYIVFILILFLIQGKCSAVLLPEEQIIRFIGSTLPRDVI